MHNFKAAFIALLIVALVILIIVWKFPMSQQKKEELKIFISGEDIPVPITTDYEGAKISPTKLLKKCANKECIPSIDEPEFESVEEADKWLEESDTIFGLNFNGVQKAYPQRILNWHEIVNDEIGGEPVAVTFDPLSGTPTSFIRKVNGVESTFGVSEFMYNSNLIFYDRKTGNLWQQINHEAIIGDAARRNEFLSWINISTTTWREWKKAYPDSKVLKKPLGTKRDYDRYPYGSYEENNEIRFGASNIDKRLHPKDIVYGVRVGGLSKAYPAAKTKLVGTFEDTIGETIVVVERKADGSFVIINKSTGEEYLKQRAFWFSWVIFNPSTLLY